jgi:hypothetical protein
MHEILNVGESCGKHHRGAGEACSYGAVFPSISPALQSLSSEPRGLRGGGLRVSTPFLQWRLIGAAGGVQLLAKAIFETNASDIPLKDCWNDLGVIGKLLELVHPPT